MFVSKFYFILALFALPGVFITQAKAAGECFAHSDLCLPWIGSTVCDLTPSCKFDDNLGECATDQNLCKSKTRDACVSPLAPLCLWNEEGKCGVIDYVQCGLSPGSDFTECLVEDHTERIQKLLLGSALGSFDIEELVSKYAENLACNCVPQYFDCLVQNECSSHSLFHAQCMATMAIFEPLYGQCGYSCEEQLEPLEWNLHYTTMFEFLPFSSLTWNDELIDDLKFAVSIVSSLKMDWISFDPATGALTIEVPLGTILRFPLETLENVLSNLADLDLLASFDVLATTLFPGLLDATGTCFAFLDVCLPWIGETACDMIDACRYDLNLGECVTDAQECGALDRLGCLKDIKCLWNEADECNIADYMQCGLSAESDFTKCVIEDRKRDVILSLLAQSGLSQLQIDAMFAEYMQQVSCECFPIYWGCLAESECSSNPTSLSVQCHATMALVETQFGSCDYSCDEDLIPLDLELVFQAVLDFVELPDWTAIPEALDDFMIALSIELAAHVEWLDFDPDTNTLVVSIPVGTLTANAELLASGVQGSLENLDESTLLRPFGIQAAKVEQTAGIGAGANQQDYQLDTASSPSNLLALTAALLLLAFQ